MLLQLRQVSKTYPSTGPVLQQLDLEAAAGETVAIVGPSGSGKSTILNLIGALDRPDTGEVLVEGRKVGELKEAEVAAYRNETVGFVFQLHHLLPQCTVLENVLVPTLANAKQDASAAHARALELLRRVGLQHRQDHRPGQLSGGERQRAAVARALINSPKLLLADEPTGALDRQTAEQLMALLVDLNKSQGVTIVMVTHAMDLAQRMQRVLEMRDGRLVAQGQ